MTNASTDHNGLIEVLHAIDFLQGLTREQLEKIASVAELVEFTAGQTVFHEGEPATHIYLVTEGSVSVEICAPGTGCQQLLTVGPGRLLGWSPILEMPRLSASARALTPTKAVKIPGGEIVSLCEQDRQFGFEIMQRAAQALGTRLTATRQQLLSHFAAQDDAPA